MLHDYTSIDAASVAAVAEQAIADAETLISTMVGAAAPRTFASTLQPLEEVSAVLTDAYGPSSFMARVHPDPEVRAKAVEVEERLAKWGNDLIFRRDLYEAIRDFSETDDAAALSGTAARLLTFWMRDLRRAGHELSDGDRDTLQALNQRLIELQVAFGNNLDEWEDAIEVTAEDLEGLPDDYVRRLRPGSEEGTFLVTMAYPDYMPFMQQARRRDLRRQLQFKFWNRAVEQNRPLLAEAVEVRQRIAALFGVPTWAHRSMEVKMAKTPETVEAFYQSLVPGLRRKAEAELAVLADLASADDVAGLQPWDWTYYDNEQRRRDFGIDPNEVAAYFPLELVLEGMFAVTGDVFGLEYHQVPDAAAWHPDVTLYEIRDAGSGTPRAYFYADLFPREGKYGHAAAFPLGYGRALPDGGYQTPVAAIVANLTKPTEDSPSLLKHGEALTLFHEFGHILHFCLTTVDLIRFAGFDTEWDFVEAPSQIMEHWMWRPEVLARFARHHETGEPIPADLVERLVAARDLNVGLATMRQLFLGKLDLLLHATADPVDLDAAYRESYRLTLLPFHEGTFFPASFGHLMGGYDAGYYGYLWAKVYGDDMFSMFEEAGVTDPEVGARYRREVLAMGGSRDAMDHLRAFLGREPSSEAFLRNLGLG
ncbi:MAG: M3 family metallopeptidase [Acidimicrobiia bacterium]|jgi:thimet oligopeptidase